MFDHWQSCIDAAALVLSLVYRDAREQGLMLAVKRSIAGSRHTLLSKKLRQRVHSISTTGSASTSGNLTDTTRFTGKLSTTPVTATAASDTHVDALVTYFTVLEIEEALLKFVR